ncbi:hypothetical protein Taro_001422 [Colocasia esculenta]|uniref:Uncharacterized protein n=1 Tax=Colocasia esculenta TaxID=4460 RepID=A0A843TG14_COLES|nr:hypothetical protein [Colocasia esculenta]
MEEHGGERPEGLEIVSIGTLYSGPWDKKYWSCSRGKDRYPYPVGYHALRTNAGVTYKMEIQEGVKGPLFVVTSNTGDSSSGQTPDIAWEYFQKKSGPRVKNCHGKRFSCKIDGIEASLFGFRNPFIQRLLRELVANIHGVAEQNVMASNNHSGTSPLKHDTQGAESHVHTDLLMFLQKQHGTRKRSRKHVSAIKEAGTAAHINRFRKQNLAHAADICISEEESAASWEMGPLKDEIMQSRILNHGPLNLKDASLLNMNSGIPDLTGCVENPVDHEPMEEKLTTVERGFNSVSLIGNVHVQPRQSDNFVGEMENKLHTMDREKLDRSLDSDPERTKLVVGAQERSLNSSNGDTNVKDLDLYIPDSLEISQGNVGSIYFGNGKENHLNNPDELVAEEPMVGDRTSCGYQVCNQDVPEELIRGNEAHTDILDPRTSVSKMDAHFNECLLDDASVDGFVKKLQSTDLGRQSGSRTTHVSLGGEDLARSMMNLLLPRAVPLLTKTYLRRRGQKHGQETSSVSDLDSSGSDSILGGEHFESPLKLIEQRIKEIGASVDTNSLCQEVKLECAYNDLTAEPITTSVQSGLQSIIPDSFEDDQCAHDFFVRRHLCASGEAGEAPSELRNDAVQTLGNNESDQKQADDKFEDDEGYDQKQGGDKFEDDEGYAMSLSLNNGSYEGESLISNSLSVCLSPGKNIVPGKQNGACLNVDESFLHPLDADKDIPCLRTYDILNSDFHPSAAEVIEGSERKLQYVLQNVPNIGRQTGYLTEVNRNTNSISLKTDGSTPDVRDASWKLQSVDDKKVICNAEDPFPLRVNADVQLFNGETPAINGMTRKLPFVSHSPSKHKVPLSESIICRNTNNGQVLGKYSDKSLHVIENRQVEVDACGINENASFYDGKEQCLRTGSNISESVGMLFNIAPPASQNQEAAKHVSHVNNPPTAEEFSDHAPLFLELTKRAAGQSQNGDLTYSDENELVKPIDNEHIDHPQTELYECQLCVSPLSKVLNPKEEFEGFVELIGCYLHPKPVLSVILTAKEDALSVCVLCGHLEGGGRELFIYKVYVKVQITYPSFIGYTSISFPVIKDACSQTIPVERSGLQFTPDGQSLVLLNSIKSPCCREKNLSCLCPLCELDCYEENAVKIVHVELGYMSTVAKLKTTGRIYCILVCEPDHLLAVEETGELHVWIMNPMWRVHLEEFILPTFDCMSPSVIELKQVPRCGHLIVGHNGEAILQALPIGLFRFPDDASATFIRVEDHVKEILLSTDFGNFQVSNTDTSLPSTGDAAVWLLVSASGLEAQHDNLMIKTDTSSVGWRLALLAKDMVLMGSLLDPRAASVSALASYGITGTTDGCVYIWELMTGNKLVNLHCFNDFKSYCQ